MPEKKIIRIGLTGGIGSGKSTVAELLREKGFKVFDMDREAQKFLNNPKVKKLCPFAFKNGKVDKNFLRAAIFSNPTFKKQLEAIIHPLVKEEFDKFSKKLHELGEKIVVCEAALLIETNYYKKLDGLIVVFSKKDIRKKRIMSRDKIGENLVSKIMANQTIDSVRREKADFIIVNNGTLFQLEEKVKILIKKLRNL